MRGYPKCVTLYPGHYVYICPCGFSSVVGRIDRKNSKMGISCMRCKQTKGKYYKVDINRELEFTTNWNNKLNCECFTTLRLYNPVKHCVGNRFSVRLNGHHKGYAKIIAVSPIRLEQINEFIARLDTGYSSEECRDIIRKMYKNKTYINWNSQLLAFCLLKYDRDERAPKLF